MDKVFSEEESVVSENVNDTSQQLELFYNLELLLCDNEPKDAMNAPDQMTEVRLCTRSRQSETFFSGIQPCNFRKEKKKIAWLNRYVKLIRDCDKVYLDLLLESTAEDEIKVSQNYPEFSLASGCSILSLLNFN